MIKEVSSYVLISTVMTHLAGAPDSADAKILDSMMATAAFSPIDSVNLTLALLSPTVTAGPIIAVIRLQWSERCAVH
jgi:hypothetical protein